MTKVLSGKPPFHADLGSSGKVIIKISQGDVPKQEDHPMKCSPEAARATWALMTRCWQKEAAGRPKMDEVSEKVSRCPSYEICADHSLSWSSSNNYGQLNTDGESQPADLSLSLQLQRNCSDI